MLFLRLLFRSSLSSFLLPAWQQHNNSLSVSSQAPLPSPSRDPLVARGKQADRVDRRFLNGRRRPRRLLSGQDTLFIITYTQSQFHILFRGITDFVPTQRGFQCRV